MEVFINYEVFQGDTRGTPILCIHGVGSSKEVWESVVAALPNDRPLVTYDQRGHGKSGKPAGPYSIDALVQDAVNLMDRLSFEKFDVVGFSLGGLVAQGLALSVPTRVRRLVVIGTVANRSTEESERALLRWSEIATEGPAAVAERSIQRWYTPEYLLEHPETRDQTIARMAALDPIAYSAAYEVLAKTDFKDRLHEIKTPTLAIAGSDDVGSPPHMSKFIVEQVENGRLVVIEGVKHNLVEAATDRIVKEISNHVID